MTSPFEGGEFEGQPYAAAINAAGKHVGRHAMFAVGGIVGYWATGDILDFFPTDNPVIDTELWPWPLSLRDIGEFGAQVAAGRFVAEQSTRLFDAMSL